ncbi:MAG: DUF2807 domain-containing protein [Bacteroidales bacterium]|nr:MAG: DUF2807 domain-containing protein [Bacteroidales bacterium]
MKKSFFTLAVCLGIGLSSILPSKLYAQISIPDITGVKEVSLNLACKVTLIQGDKPLLSITGDEDVLEDLKVSVRGDELIIRNNNHHQHKSDVSITITLPDLKEISLGGVVDITTPNQIKFDNLKVEVGGVANLDLNIKTKAFELDASGVLSGNIIGETKDLKIEISGVGKLDASEFKSENCDVDVSGIAKAVVYAVEQLDASVSGLGKISYVGRPIINRSCSGFGWISRL